MAVRDSHGRFVRSTDHGYDALMKRVGVSATGGPSVGSPGSGASVTVGIHDEQGDVQYENGATVAEVASYNELGLGVPRRSFIADYVDENEAKIQGQLEAIGKAVVSGAVASPAQGLDRFGVLQVGEVQMRIKSHIAPDNEQSTIDAKGSSTPLIGKEALLWTSISHKVQPGKQ